MRLNLHWHRLRASQRHAVFALGGVVVGVALDNSALIEAQFPGVKWLGTAFILAGALKTALSRSLVTSRSGTGTGLVDDGPDTKARAAAGGTAPENAQRPTEVTQGANRGDSDAPPDGQPLSGTDVTAGELLADVRAMRREGLDADLPPVKLEEG